MTNKYNSLPFWHPQFERCGFILQSGEIVEVANIHAQPENNFEISEADLLKYSSRAEYFWHSHTHDSPNLSIADYKAFLKYPNHKHVIFCYDKYAVYYIRNDLVYRDSNGNNFGVSS